jgi:hypothetical protein
MKMNNTARLCLVGMTVAAGTLGCRSGDRGDMEPLARARPQINLIASNRDIVAGDVTTFTITSRNTLGKQADVEWASSGGGLVTEDEGRIARVQFNEPGTYTVTARLFVDNTEVDNEMATVNVRPVK